MFFLLQRQTSDGVFDDFPKISDHSPKILQNFSEGYTNAGEHFPKIPAKIAEDPKMFRSHTNEFKLI